MYCLGIDTSSAIGSIAISSNGVPICRHTISVDMAHSVKILPTMEKAISEAGIAKKDLNAVAVGVGPGSYTGVRVGIAFAKGIGFGLKIPVVGVCSFESMLYAHKNFDGAICTLVDAKLGGTFWAAYLWKGDDIETIKPPTVSQIEDIEFECGSRVIFLSPDIEKFISALKIKFRQCSTLEFKEAFPDAEYTAILGEKKLAEKGKHPEMKLEPYYLRPSMAEITAAKTQGKK